MPHSSHIHASASLLTPTANIYYGSCNEKSARATAAVPSSRPLSRSSFTSLRLFWEALANELVVNRPARGSCGFRGQGSPKERPWETRLKVNRQFKGVFSFRKGIRTQLTRHTFGNLTQRKLSGPFLQSHFASCVSPI